MFWKKVGRATPYVLFYIIAVAVVGFFNWVSAGFTDETIRSATFWNRTISQNIANLLIFVSTIGLYLMKGKESNEKYKKLEATVDDAVEKDLDASFGEWVALENKRLKIEAYKDRIKRKIVGLESRALQRSLIIWYEGTEQQKRRNRFCRRRMRLEQKMDDKRLDRLIMSMWWVSYDKIDRNFVETGEENHTGRQNRKKDSTWRKLQDIVPKFSYSLGATVFFNAFIYDFKEVTPEFIFQLAVSLGVLLSMFIAGRKYGLDYVNTVLITDLNTRLNIIKYFLTFKIKSRKEAMENGNK